MFKTKIDKISLVISVILIVVAILVAPRLFKSSPDQETQDISGFRRVSVASIASITSNISPLPLTGKVESESQVTLRAQSQGEVRGVYRSLGSFVSAGAIIAELENSAQRARVSQSQATLDSAVANLAKTDAGARVEDIAIIEARLEKDKNSLDEASRGLKNSIRSAYTSANSSLRGNIDQFFSGSSGSSPSLNFNTDAKLRADLEWNRFVIENDLGDFFENIEDISTEEVDEFLERIRSFINDTALAVNGLNSSSNLSQTTIDTWKASIVIAQSTISGAITSLSVVKENLNNKSATLFITEQEYERILSGARSEDVAIVEAQVSQARAILAEANAALEKTIIRSPISGTINRLDIDPGDFVSQFADVAEVSNNNALQIQSFITEEDRHDIVVGALVSIEGGLEGVVTSVAPALDPETRKIEMTVGILNENVSLTNGESVRLLVDRVGAISVTNGSLTVPLSALKINPDNITVFTVSDQNLLVGHEVKVGPIRGNDVIIESGIDTTMEIVLDARGLLEGEMVIIE